MDQDFKDQLIRYAVITALISFVFGFVGGGIASGWLAGRVPNFLAASNNAIKIESVSLQEAVVKVVKDSSPAVVSIIATKDLPVIEQYSDPFGGYFPFQIPLYRQNGTQQQEVGGGSGFIINSDGLIVTNKHVVDIDGAEYTVLTNDGTKYPAQVLAKDPVQDIAILKINKTGLPTVKLGSAQNLEIGQSVIAIGNALGEFRNTVSVGVVSGLGRSVVASSGQEAEQLEGVIQTDAAINPGNSGGPLLNLAGEVIGINVAMAQGAQNIAFSLPIDLALRDISQVQKEGKITYPYIGVRYVLITSSLKAERNLPVDYGALLINGDNINEPAVVPNSPADKSGLKENDIILEIDGQKINNDNPLARIIQNHNVGDTINLKVLRNGQEKNVKVILGER